MAGRRARQLPGVIGRRRSGPPTEEQWWEPNDQAFVQQPMLSRHDFPKGWRPAMMLNNQEALDPYADVEAADAIRRARAARVLTGLDEGAAYRARNHLLLVLRTEAFLRADEAGHRDAWHGDGPAALTATYRARWAEREVTPNWIETTVRRPGELPANVDPRIDWLRVEDHTDPKREGSVQIYEHLTLWCGRAHAVVTVRHGPEQHLEDMAQTVAEQLLARLELIPAAPGPPEGPSPAAP